MIQEIIFTALNSNESHEESVELPRICPICGFSLVPKISAAISLSDLNEDGAKAFLLNYCSQCDECFISQHIYDEEEDVYAFLSSSPTKHTNQYFSDNIRELSPDFVSIYNDSLIAEKQGLLSICGMGYRKSLEFLIKDYAISLAPSKRDDILKTSLSSCIKKYINDERLKTLATASAWIGNDETHYVKKNPNYGIENQKAFINAFVTFIDSDLAYSQAKKFTSI
ncbi:MAG: hypothetical protein K1W34_13940 [Lachnospiraceae bacterium]